jgi:hypothetical protein
MKRKLLVMLAAISLVVPLWGQSTGKLAEMNKKVVGKWWSGDHKEFIEFAANGSCTEGSLISDGSWNVYRDNLRVYADQSFICADGELTLVGPNTLTRERGRAGVKEKYYRGLNGPKPVPALTLALAHQILNQQLDIATSSNKLYSCMACWDPNDKRENDNAPLVSTYSDALTQFLIRRGYVRSSGGQLVFTAKDKQSKYYGADGGPGLRFARFRNPRILTSQIADRTHVPIEYELVPTDLTMAFFQTTHRVKATASFTFENEKWEIRLLP